MLIDVRAIVGSTVGLHVGILEVTLVGELDGLSIGQLVGNIEMVIGFMFEGDGLGVRDGANL